MIKIKPKTKRANPRHDKRVVKATYFMKAWHRETKIRGKDHPRIVQVMKDLIIVTTRFFKKAMAMSQKGKASDPMDDIYEATALLSTALALNTSNETVGKPYDHEVIMAFVAHTYYLRLRNSKKWKAQASATLLLIDEAYCTPMNVTLVDFCRQYTERVEREWGERPWYKRKTFRKWEDIK